MKKLLVLSLAVLFGLTTQAKQTPTVYEQLCELNKQWLNKDLDDPILQEHTELANDVELIQMHLSLVEETLRNTDVSSLSETQKANREQGLDILHDYWMNGVFPINLYHTERTPYFIDHVGTACAVGQIVIETGFEDFAQQIHEENNYGYIYDLEVQYPGLRAWADEYGFRMDELAWIQPTYGGGTPGVGPTTVFIDPTCAGSCDGVVSQLADPGGIPPYTVSGPNGSGLCAGTYTWLIMDGMATTYTAVVTLTDPTPVISTYFVTEPTCGGSCDGQILLTTTGGTLPYTVSDPNGGPDIPYASTVLIPGVCAGTYTLVVTDANGCEEFVIVTVTEPTPIIYTTSVTDESTAGSCDGSITITATGGTPAYQYSINCGVAYQPSGTFTGLCAGTYPVMVQDANGCQTTCDPIVVNTGTGCTMVTTWMETDPLCSYTCDGTVTVIATGGTPPYTVNDPVTGSPITFTGTYMFTGLCPTAYTFLVEDALGCQDFYVANLLPPSPISTALTSTPETAPGACDGSITSSVTGGVTPYVYNWVDCATYSSIGQTTPIASGLCNGDYALIVYDANGCVDTSACETITATGCTIVSTVGGVTDASCNGSCDGTAIIVTTAGTPPYTVTVAGSPYTYSSVVTVTGLCAGTYTAVVEDALGCINTLVFTVNEPAPILVAATVVDETSPGACDGTVTITASGGTTPYQYSIDCGSTFQASNIFTSLCAGTVGIMVMDANGCISSCDPYIINSGGGSGCSISAYVDEFADCTGSCNGSLFVYPTSGTAPYTYSLDGITYQSANYFDMLCDGTYTVYILDDAGCADTINAALVSAPFITSWMETDPLCSYSCDGTVTVTATGGTPPYIVYDPMGGGPITFTSSYTFTGLCPTAYTFLVEDAMGCQDFYVANLLPPAPISTTLTPTPESSPGACDGTMATSTTGGAGGPYIYDWVSCPAYSQIGQTTPTATGLCAGNYAVVTYDGNGCADTSACETITATGCTMVSTYSTTSVTCNGDCDGTVFLSTTGGALPYTVNDPMGGPDISYSSVVIIPNLCAGTYTLVVEDALGCQEFLIVTITEPAPLVYTTSVVDESTPGGCDGSITITATGGTPGYMYSIDCGVTYQTSGVFTGLCAGTYPVMVQDANGCQTTCDPIVVNPGTGCTMVSTYSATNVTCYGDCDGSIIVFTTGGTMPYTVSDPMGGPDIIYTSAGTIWPVCAGTYTLTIEDAMGCQEFLVVTITEPAPVVAMTTVTSQPSAPGACDGQMVGTATGGTSGYAYEWIDCDTGTPLFITTPTATGLCAGNYAMVATDVNGCADTSTCETLVDPVGVDDHNKAFGFEVYPNPTNGLLNIMLTQPSGNKTSLDVLNVLGQVIHNHTITGIGNTLLSIDMRELGVDRGVYFVRLSSGEADTTVKVIFTE